MSIVLDNFIKENIAPYAAYGMAVFDSTGNYVGNIGMESGFKPAFGNRLYRFGVLSDVHNRTDNSVTNATEDLQRALTFFNDKESVEFTCICGDITQQGTSGEGKIFYNNVRAKSPSTPVYTCAGNHDTYQAFGNTGNYISNLTHWLAYANPTTEWDTGKGMNGKHSCITKTHTIGSGDDAVTITDNFIFFSMNSYSLGDSGVPYTADDISWLSGILEAHKNERCFIFMHLFFPSRSGNYGNIYPSGNWMGGSTLTSIQNLCDSYPNTIWFSGHSHWNWNLQGTQTSGANASRGRNYDANIYPVNGATRECGWCVHIPSCASPIDSTDAVPREELNYPTESQFGIVDVYENYIDIRGMFLDTDGQLKYMPIAQYRLDTTLRDMTSSGGDDDEPVYASNEFHPNWFYANGVKGSTPKLGATNGPVTYQFANGHNGVELTFTATSEGYLIYPSCLSTSNTSQTPTGTVKLTDLEVVNTSGTVITSNITDKVGFYLTNRAYALTSLVSETGISLGTGNTNISYTQTDSTSTDSVHTSSISGNLIQFNTSSGATEGFVTNFNYPIKIRFAGTYNVTYGDETTIPTTTSSEE